MKLKKVLSYIVVRRDLTPAQQVVQASHAAMEMALQRGPLDGEPATIYIAALGVNDEKELMEVVKKVSMENKVLFELFHEPDDNIGYTALCTRPSEEHSNILAKLPLL